VLSSVVTATVMAAWWLGPLRGRGGTLDLSMAEVVATTVGEFVAEASAVATRTQPRGCELAPFAPHGVYRTADDRWVAVSVQSDDERHRVVSAVGDPPSLAGARWARADARFEDRAQLDLALGPVIAHRTLEDVVSAFSAAGVRCAAVLDGRGLVADAHLVARGFFAAIDHPDPELTDARIVGLGWRFVGEGPVALRPPPALGSTTLDADDERAWAR
jgi:crotonobetainyl-CoA:carnitine CoA-transferase CaiB-like acyl-CoA transferase